MSNSNYITNEEEWKRILTELMTLASKEFNMPIHPMFIDNLGTAWQIDVMRAIPSTCCKLVHKDMGGE